MEDDEKENTKSNCSDLLLSQGILLDLFCIELEIISLHPFTLCIPLAELFLFQNCKVKFLALF